jgi:hypothetical protein
VLAALSAGPVEMVADVVAGSAVPTLEGLQGTGPGP